MIYKHWFRVNGFAVTFITGLTYFLS